MSVSYSNKIGLIATIVFHILLAILFLILNIDSSNKYIEDDIFIEFEENVKLDILEEKKEKLKSPLEKYKSDIQENSSNKAVNLSSKSIFNDNVAPSNYNTGKEFENISDDRIQEEMDKYFHPDKYKKKEEKKTNNFLDKPEKKNEKQQEKKNEYKGKTNVSYDLGGRKHRYLHIPVYKCKGEGIITVDIIADSEGKVINAKINNELSDSHDPCLRKSALQSALRSSFKISMKSSKGKISYIFVPQ